MAIGKLKSAVVPLLEGSSVSVAILPVLASTALLAGCGAEPGDPGAGRDSTGREMGEISRMIVEENRENDRVSGLVARLEVQPNELLEFYEPVPGQLLISGAGAPEGGKLAIRDLGRGQERLTTVDLRRIWQRASNGAAIPDQLEAALQRAEEIEPPKSVEQTDETELPPLIEKSASEHIGVNRSAIHSGSDFCNAGYETADATGAEWPWFDIGTCSNDPLFEEKHCWDHRTGSGSASNDDAYIVQSNVCPYRGQVLFKIESDEAPTSSFTVSQSTARWMVRMDNGCYGNIFDDCQWIKTSVSQADGDGYHYRFYAHEG